MSQNYISINSSGISVLGDEFQDRRMFLFRKEVKVAKSRNDLMTSQSKRQLRFPNFEMLDAKIVSVLKRIISNPRQKEIQRGRAKSSNTGQISSRKTDCLHVSVSLQGDDIQDF